MPAVDYDRSLEQFSAYLAENGPKLQTCAKSFEELIRGIITDNIEIESISSRIKSYESAREKFNKKYRLDLEENNANVEVKDKISDLVGVRIVCLYQDDINKLRHIITNEFIVINTTDKIEKLNEFEDKFGYRSLHLDLAISSNRRNLPEYRNCSDQSFELQIRTIIQDAWSQLDHKIKYKKEIPANLKRRINRLAAIFELADDEFQKIHDETINELKEASEALDSKNTQNVNTNEELILNSFSCMAFLKRTYPLYKFWSNKVDDFVDEVINIDPGLTLESLIRAHDNNISFINAYQAEIHFAFSPFTIIRHALYLQSPEKYAGLLYYQQKASLALHLRDKGLNLINFGN